jgi:hypothetical protein
MDHHYGASPAQPNSVMSSLLGGHTPAINNSMHGPGSVMPPGSFLGASSFGPGSIFGPSSIMGNNGPNSVLARSIDQHNNGPGKEILTLGKNEY